MYYFPYWLEAFNASSQLRKYKNVNSTRCNSISLPFIDKKDLHIGRQQGSRFHGRIYNTRQMQTAIGIAYVYTPPYYRRKGYATSFMAQLSQMALDQGFKRCVLYTDLLNPTSNSIYQKIGYEPICDSLMLKFEKHQKLNHL